MANFRSDGRLFPELHPPYSPLDVALSPVRVSEYILPPPQGVAPHESVPAQTGRNKGNRFYRRTGFHGKSLPV